MVADVAYEVPAEAPDGTVLKLLPREDGDEYYYERTDRNVGWITREEQEYLRGCCIGIAGCGGMGGLLASVFVRLGIGEVRIADCETFDTSNINRQFAAVRETVGKSKALETAREVRRIADDGTLVVYTAGICEATVDEFTIGCDIICDEIEAFALLARILLHQRARTHGVSLFNCNSIGFSTNLFLFTPESMTLEEALQIDYDRAHELQRRAVQGDIEAVRSITAAMIRALLPNLPEYSSAGGVNRDAFYRRMTQEGKVPIIGTNPTFAAGFLANRVLLHLLRNSGVSRTIQETPVYPGYLHLDAAHIVARVAHDGGWINGRHQD